MRRIRFTSRFTRDYKRVQKGHPALQKDLQPILDLLVEDVPLPARNRDHALKGEWIRFRDGHVRPDLVLIYRRFEPQMLELSRLGSHSDLFSN